MRYLLQSKVRKHRPVFTGRVHADGVPRGPRPQQPPVHKLADCTRSVRGRLLGVTRPLAEHCNQPATESNSENLAVETHRHAFLVRSLVPAAIFFVGHDDVVVHSVDERQSTRLLPVFAPTYRAESLRCHGHGSPEDIFTNLLHGAVHTRCQRQLTAPCKKFVKIPQGGSCLDSARCPICCANPDGQSSHLTRREAAFFGSGGSPCR